MLSGTPTTAGSPFTVQVTATDAVSYTGNTASKSFSLTVNAAPALASLALSGSPSLTYSGTPVTYDLSGLTLAGKDQYGAAFDITGQTVNWAVVSGNATVSGSTLTINSDGVVTVTASIGTVTSNNLGLTVGRASGPDQPRPLRQPEPDLQRHAGHLRPERPDPGGQGPVRVGLRHHRPDGQLGGRVGQRRRERLHPDHQQRRGGHGHRLDRDGHQQ